MHLFRVENGNLEIVNSLNFDSPPLCASFDGKGRLWVSTITNSTSSSQVLSVFVYNSSTNNYVALPENDEYNPIVQKINASCSFGGMLLLLFMSGAT